MSVFGRCSIWFLSALLLFLSLWSGFAVSVHFYWAAAVFGTLFLLGTYDFFQLRHTLWRNYPIIAHFRWLLEDLRPYLRQYIVEGDLEGRPFNREQRSLVYARAKGYEDYHPFGSELNVYSDEYEWLTQSINPCKPAEDDLRIDVGGPQCRQPYSASILNISAMSFGSLGAKAIEALNMGAAQGGFYHDTGEGGISPYHEKHGGDLVWEIGTGYFGCRSNEGGFDPEKFKDKAQSDQVKMIEIKISQGAKPGHGGVLPGEKVTLEIAETRGVEPGKCIISPPGHSTFSTPVQMMEWVAKLRELSGGKPVGIKLCVGKPHEIFSIIKAMQETEILLDFIVVDGGEGGTGAAPQEFTNHFGMPLREGLILVRNALVGSGLKPNIRLAASGKVHSAFSIASKCAFGADWCNAARAFMFTLGCVQSLKCHTDLCPTGVTTQNAARQRGLIIPDKAERVEKFHKRTVEALKELLSAGGFQHPEELQPSHLYYRVNPVQIETIDRLFPFLKTGELGANMDNELYRGWWTMASADTFKAQRQDDLPPESRSIY